MRHLDDEALARLADGDPEPDESRHLDECDTCRKRREEFRDDAHLLKTMPRVAPPASEWPRVRAALRGHARRRSMLSAVASLAAALLMFAAGMYVGAKRHADAREQGSAMPAPRVLSASEATVRLAAFEAALLTTREAAGRVPHDPVLEEYERLTLTARDSLLHAVNLTSQRKWY